jgi:hypothetical protein
MQRIAFKHLGLILQKAAHKEFIKSKLEVMLSTADSNSESERTGCAQGIGLCSAAHLDMALEKVQSPTPGTFHASSISLSLSSHSLFILTLLSLQQRHRRNRVEACLAC